MCEQCEKIKAAEAAERKTREVIRTVSPQLLADFKAHVLAKGNAELDVDQLVLNGKRAVLNGDIDDGEAKARQAIIDNAMQKNAEQFDAERTALWNRIYDEMGLVGLDRGMGYSIDHDTGEVWQRRQPLESLLGRATGVQVHVIRD